MTKRNPIDYLGKRFIIYLTLVVVLIISSANYIRFANYRAQVHDDMDNHAAITLGYISDLSLHYIDSYETELLKKLQLFILNDKDLDYLVINNYLANEKYGNKTSPVSAGVKEYSKDLMLDGRIVGRIEFGLDKTVYDERIAGFKLISWQIVAVVVLSLVGLIFIFYKRNIAREIYRFRSALDGSSDAIYLIDRKSLHFVDANKNGWEILGYSRDELLEKRIDELCTVCESCVNFSDGCLGPDCKLFSLNRLFFKGSTGSVIPMEISFNEINYASDELLIAVARDITLTLKTEMELVEAKEKAEKASRAKSDFLACMSHELRTPLNAVLGFGQLLEMNLKDPEERENAQCILDAGRHLLSLVNDVLDLSRIDSGNLKLSIKHVDPVLLIHDCVNMATPMANKYSVSIVCDDTVKDLPAIKADPSRFKQVLLNLLSNAIKYNSMGGVVLIRGKQLPSAMLRIEVKDTGIGIPESRYCELFTPFHRLGAEGSSIEGVGIGLSMTKQLVRLMSGVVDFVSEEGKGSLFWFDLPVVKEFESGQLLNDSASGSVGEQIKKGSNNFSVLYIEDNPSNQSLMRGVLSGFPEVELECIHNAEMGLDYVSHSDVDLLFMDIDLPGMNGIEATRILKNNECTRHIPVIAVSANAMPSDIDSASDVGFECYLTKPFDVSEIIRIVRSKLK